MRHHRQLTALRQQARQIKHRRSSTQNHPIIRAEEELLNWVLSRPDLAPVTPWEDLDTSKPQPAGQRVLIEGEPWFLKLRALQFHGACWIHPTPQPEMISAVNPVELFQPEEDPELIRDYCRAAAVIRAAAEGECVPLGIVLDETGLNDAAAMVRQYDDGVENWGPTLVPDSFPSPRTLLQAAFHHAGWELALSMLKELCDGGAHWTPWPEEYPFPLGGHSNST